MAIRFEGAPFQDEVYKFTVKRNDVWLGSIEEWEGEIRYVHRPDRETYNAVSAQELRTILEKMDSIPLKPLPKT